MCMLLCFHSKNRKRSKRRKIRRRRCKSRRDEGRSMTKKKALYQINILKYLLISNSGNFVVCFFFNSKSLIHLRFVFMIWQFLNLILFYKWLTGNISLIIQFNISRISLGTYDVLSKNSSDPWLHSGERSWFGQYHHGACNNPVGETNK